MTYDEAMAELRTAGIRFPEDPEDAEWLLDDAMEACDETVVYFGGPYMIDLPRLTDTRVFTHRISADDLSGEVIELDPDIVAFLKDS